ncbi:MAG: DUF4198 domain-containing protein [Pseudomonadota bacterium]
MRSNISTTFTFRQGGLALRSIVAGCTLLSLGTAGAHQAWLEQNAKEATLYFGEFGENLRETSPGLLDKFVQPVAQKISAKGNAPLAVAKSANGFPISGRAAKGESIVAEEPGYPVSERKDGDKVTRSIYVPAARLVTDFSQQAPVLTLDLVPTGQPVKGAVEVQAFYKGQPLPKAKVVIVTSAGWSQEHRTDAQGKLTAALPWKGTYVLELTHNDTTGGERNAEKYHRASYVTSLTLPQTAGLGALPASPPATPNK